MQQTARMGESGGERVSIPTEQRSPTRRPSVGPPPPVEDTAAALFEALWRELTDVLGTVAAAALLRRALKRAAARAPELRTLEVVREDWEYRYVLPAGWSERRADAVPPFAELTSDLVPLLREFTGQIVLRRLARVPELHALGLAPPEVP